MAGFDYKQSYAWNDAIKLSQDALSLVETLPETARALADQMARAAIKVPAKVANQLIKREEAKLGAILELASAIELVDRVYPALDTAPVQREIAELLIRLQSPSFTELKPAEPSVVPQVPEADLEVEAEEPEEDEPEEEDGAPVPAPTSIKVQDS